MLPVLVIASARFLVRLGRCNLALDQATNQRVVLRLASAVLVAERRRGKSDPARFLEQKLADDKRACRRKPSFNGLRGRMMLTPLTLTSTGLLSRRS
jgi:hypothetical protein